MWQNCSDNFARNTKAEKLQFEQHARSTGCPNKSSVPWSNEPSTEKTRLRSCGETATWLYHRTWEWLIDKVRLKVIYEKLSVVTLWRDPDARSPFPRGVSCRMLFAWPCKPTCRNCNTKNETVTFRSFAEWNSAFVYVVAYTFKCSFRTQQRLVGIGSQYRKWRRFRSTDERASTICINDKSWPDRPHSLLHS